MGRADYYKHGDRNAICDRCGFKFKLGDLSRTWDNLLVCSNDWEPEHPQNYLKLRPEIPRKVEGRPEGSDVWLDEERLLLENRERLLLEDGTFLILD